MFFFLHRAYKKMTDIQTKEENVFSCGLNEPGCMILNASRLINLNSSLWMVYKPQRHHGTKKSFPLDWLVLTSISVRCVRRSRALRLHSPAARESQRAAIPHLSLAMCGSSGRSAVIRSAISHHAKPSKIKIVIHGSLGRQHASHNPVSSLSHGPCQGHGDWLSLLLPSRAGRRACLLSLRASGPPRKKKSLRSNGRPCTASEPKLTQERERNTCLDWALHVYVCVISPSVRHTLSSYKAISGPPQGLLTRGEEGRDDITQLSSFLFVYLHPFPSPPSLLFLLLSPLRLTFPEPSDAAVFIKGIWCKIRTTAKRVRDYLVLPPSPSPPTPCSVWAEAVPLQDEPLAKFSLIRKYVIDVPQLSFHFERLDLMDIFS